MFSFKFATLLSIMDRLLDKYIVQTDMNAISFVLALVGKIHVDAHSAYEMCSWYKCLIVSLVFSHLGFWSGNLFLIAHFPDLCLLVPFLRGYSEW